MLRLCTLVVLLCRVVTESRQTEREDTYTQSTYLWEKIKFGKRWQVYIQIMAYDVLHSSFYGQQFSKYGTPKTLLSVISNLTTIAGDQHPCRKGTVAVRGRQVNGKFFVHQTSYFDRFMTASSRICGLFNFIYTPSHYSDESDAIPRGGSGMDQIYPGIHHKVLTNTISMQAGEGFQINCTLSEFTHVKVKHYLQQYADNWYSICPNWGKRNFVAAHIKVSLFMEYYQKPAFLHKGDQHFTKLSFHYHIWDFSNESLELDMFPMMPTRQAVKLGMAYTLGMYQYNGDTYLLPKSPLLYVGKFPNAWIYTFALYTDSLFTPVTSRENITCSIPEAETIFYDGPVQTFWEPVLPLLKHWSCSKMLDNATGGRAQDEVRGSVGELNIIFLLPGAKTHDYFYLAIAWHAERILPGVLQIRKIVLSFSTVRTINFHPTRSTSVEVVHVKAPEGKFVHLWFSEINYVLHSEMHSSSFFQHCLDGFDIKGPMMIRGKVCSNATAENLLDRYRMDGLTVGQHITLKKKQYSWLATISAVITTGLHSCVGYINLFPRNDMLFWSRKAPWAMVKFDADKVHFENGTFAGYTNFKVVFKRSHKACCKIEVVPFDELVSYEVDMLNHMYNFFKYTIISEDLVSPARFIMTFTSINGTLQFENKSSLYGLRVVSLNNRYVKHTLRNIIYTGVWDTEAYSADIGLHSSSLTHAAGLTVQVEDGSTLPLCTREHITNVNDVLFDLTLNGPCAYAQFNEPSANAVLIYKTYEATRCCQLEGHITTDHSIRGNIAMYLLLSEKYERWLGNMWNLFGNNFTIKFQLLCAQSCLGIVVQWSPLHVYFHSLVIAYRASLLEQTYTGITFQHHLRLTFDLATPQSPLDHWNKVCYSYRCYTTPRRPMVATWDEAQKACEEQQATLVSINSDLEWALLTRLPQQEGKQFIELYNIGSFVIYYIGLVTDVSTKQAAKINMLAPIMNLISENRTVLCNIRNSISYITNSISNVRNSVFNIRRYGLNSNITFEYLV